jgi:hypothetical protein
MAEWVLIAVLASYNGGGPAVIEFKTEEACKRAIDLMQKEFKDRYRAGVCLPRS